MVSSKFLVNFVFFANQWQNSSLTAIIYFDWYKGSIRTSIILWYTRNLAWRKGHTAGTPEQAWPARPRFGLDFQIHKVEVRYLFLKALILTKGQAWQKSSSAITCDKKLKLYCGCWYKVPLVASKWVLTVFTIFEPCIEKL